MAADTVIENAASTLISPALHVSSTWVTDKTKTISELCKNYKTACIFACRKYSQTILKDIYLISDGMPVFPAPTNNTAQNVVVWKNVSYVPVLFSESVKKIHSRWYQTRSDIKHQINKHHFVLFNIKSRHF